MKECIASSSCGPEVTVKDTLTELLRKGARELIAKAVEAELEVLLAECSSLRLEDGRAAVVRNGYLPERTVQTGIGDVGVRMPGFGNANLITRESRILTTAINLPRLPF